MFGRVSHRGREAIGETRPNVGGSPLTIAAQLIRFSSGRFHEGGALVLERIEQEGEIGDLTRTIVAASLALAFRRCTGGPDGTNSLEEFAQT